MKSHDLVLRPPASRGAEQCVPYCQAPSCQGVLVLAEGPPAGWGCARCWQARPDSWESLLLPVPLAHLQGGQVLSDAWTAHMFTREPHPHSRWAGNAILLVPLTALSLLWVSIATTLLLENCQILEQKGNGSPPPLQANKITEAWSG